MDVLMPQLGETVAEGKITKWFVAAGAAIRPGDNLFEIETDKVSMEVPSTTTGVLAEIRVSAGEVAPVGAVVAVIADGSGAASSAPAVTATQTPLTPAQAGVKQQAPLDSRLRGNERETSAPPAQLVPMKLDPFFEVRTPARNFGPARLPGGVTVTPLARRLAGEAGIDLSRISGSGPRGRIVARDLAAQPQPSPAPAEGPSAAEIKALYSPDSYQEVPLDGMRRTIAARLTQAVQTVPQFYLTADIEIGRLIALREEANAAAAPLPGEGKAGAALKLSLNDFIIRALALALQRVPAANAVWAGDRILRFKHSDIGVAVALDGGLITPIVRHAEEKSLSLITPIVRHAEEKSLSAISAEIKDLAARARDKKLKPSEYQGGASAISNLGMHHVREFTAIIDPPHATILAVGAARRQAVEQPDGGARFVSMLSVTLGCDHRVVDGALGAELLAAVKTLLESPVSMLV